jgi:hypothetical protein
MKFKRTILGIVLLVIILGLTVFGLYNLYKPPAKITTQATYCTLGISCTLAVCNGQTYNLNQNPLACDTVNLGMQQCRHTIYGNGTEFIEISETPENETC